MAAKRGSQKMKDVGGGFDEKRLKALVSELKRLKLDPDVIINGQPRPDWVTGTFAASSPDRLAAGLKTVFSAGPAKFRINDILIRGIPIPDEIFVNFDFTPR